MGYELTQKCVTAYCRAMREEEKSPETVEKYRRTACAFARWLDGREVTKELAAQWKASLLTAGYAPASINAMVSAINGLFRFLVWDGFRVRFLRVQRRLFREASRELTREEYDRLHTTASAMGRKRLCLLMETLAATGMRVSEARYITVEAARRGCAEIALKGKIRVILLSGKLCRKLLRYAREQRILSGAIFRTRSGREMSRPPNLDGAQGVVLPCAGVSVQGVSPQPAPPVRNGVLSRVQGYRAACRRAGTLLHRNHPAVPDDLRRGTSPAAGTARACGVDGINIPFHQPGAVGRAS